jgi:hypothetical protein
MLGWRQGRSTERASAAGGNRAAVAFAAATVMGLGGCALAMPFDELSGGASSLGNGADASDCVGPLCVTAFSLSPAGPYALGSEVSATVTYANVTDAEVAPQTILIAVRPNGLPHTIGMTPPDDFPWWQGIIFAPGSRVTLQASQSLHGASAGTWEVYPTYCLSSADCANAFGGYRDGPSLFIQVEQSQ